MFPPADSAERKANLSSESFSDFLASFSYGSRNDLIFKFLKGLDDEAGFEFFQSILTDLESAIDAGDLEPLLQTVYEWQVRAYAPASDDAHPFAYDDAPWTPLTKPLAESRLGLLTTGGVFVEGDDPLGEPGITQAEAVDQINAFLRRAPTLSTIPIDTPAEKLRIRHPGYDVRGSRRDYNSIFPLDRLLESVASGRLGELAPEALSTVGAAAQLRVRSDFGPAIAAHFHKYEIDAAFLVAA